MKKSKEAEEKREKKKIRKGKEKNKRENMYIDTYKKNEGGDENRGEGVGGID